MVGFPFLNSSLGGKITKVGSLNGRIEDDRFEEKKFRRLFDRKG